VPDGQWYLHLFAPEQPDLNWHNREVRDDFLTTLRFWSDRGVDGFRVDVANGLAKDLPDPLPDDIVDTADLMNGSKRLWDRDEVHEIYAEWRKVFDEYDPPRTAVAEAWVETAERRVRYASSEGLGQAFNFDLLKADWDPARYREIITKNLTEARTSGASSTWVFSNHDVIRHATRYGLPPGTDQNAWLLSDGTEPPVDTEKGGRRAKAATLLMLALPGSAYLYQGEELGLHEVADLPADALQDPTFVRSGGAEKGRDGCRVPLPWTIGGSSFGFGTGKAHLPQPAWFGAYSVEAEDADPASTLHVYRRALEVRRRLQAAEELEWVGNPDEPVLHFVRPGGWHSVTNFGPEPVALPAGTVVVSSGPLDGDRLPTDTTAWIAPA
jgi:alpha-glucosidase